jgi:hypothetical protein
MVGTVSVDLGAIVMNWMTHVATLQNIGIGVWLALSYEKSVHLLSIFGRPLNILILYNKFSIAHLFNFQCILYKLFSFISVFATLQNLMVYIV